MNKLKKVEAALSLREEKIIQLETIIQSNNKVENIESLDKSGFGEKVEQSDLQLIQQEKEKL